MPTPRREFLGWLGASTMFAAAGAPLALPRSAGAQRVPVSDQWDMGWVDRLKGKHRAVFDSPAMGEGDALFRAAMWRDQNKEVYGTDAAEMNAVLVVRHAAINLVMNDAFWDRFNLGKEEKLRDSATRKWSKKNPFLTTPPDTPPKYADYSLERFMATGGTVLACNVAFGQVVYQFVKADKLDRAAARQKALEYLVPGVTLQPSGVFAVLCAQEAGCNYILAS